MNLAQQDSQIIWHPYTQMQTAGLPLAIVKAAGAEITDDTGKTYIDAISSWWVTLHGHCHPYIQEKITRQLQQLDHVIFAGFTHQPAVELAQKLLQILPPNQQRIFYSDNGSTAVEVALKMAFQYWDNQKTVKNKIIAFRDSYHGDTFGAMSVSSRSAFTRPFNQYLFEVLFIDVPVPGQEAACREQMQEYVRRPDVAAFIFEPLVLGTAGMVMYEPEILDQLLLLCQEKQIFTIADEVMTGFGRTGKNFATDYLQHQPDIFCLSKGLTGGTMALGVTSCTSQIYQGFLSPDAAKTFFHGHSYTANPIACTAGIASYDLLIKPDTQAKINFISNQHKAFKTSLEAHRAIKQVRQTGTILSVEFDTGPTSYFSQVRDLLYNLALENGVLLRPLGNIIYVLPPYCITPPQLQKVYSVIEKMADLIANS